MDIWEQLSFHHIHVCVPYKFIHTSLEWTHFQIGLRMKSTQMILSSTKYQYFD